MAKTTINPENPEAFARLMRLGRVSKAQGDLRLAHEYWRDAALLRPERVEVWKALLEVLDDEADRRVCLQNILALEPENRAIRQELTELNEQEPERPTFLNAEQTISKRPLVRPQRQTPPQKRWTGRILQYGGEILLVVLITLALLNIEQIIEWGRMLLETLTGLP
jgi:tetratricopeptide (TPR) repeat protein